VAGARQPANAWNGTNLETPGENLKRLTEIDALRGFAAMSVVAFHYTYKYDELYGFNGQVPFQLSWGYLGVNLFFVISGFVIFMTLDRTRIPIDFIVSRASRLYPSYWAAVILTTLITHLLGLPGKEVSWHTAILSFTMIQQLFGIPLVDSVYWTLLVELFFYGLAFLLFITKSMHRALAALSALLSLRLVYWAFASFAHIDLPWRISQVFILEYIPFFALGIVAYRLVRDATTSVAENLGTAVFAVAVLAIAESLLMAGVAVVCFGAVWAAASGRLPFLRLRGFVWLGGISYPLYLLHENIGWAVMRQLQLHGMVASLAILVTTAGIIVFAAALSYGIERPAMAWIRRRYKLTRTYQLSH